VKLLLWLSIDIPLPLCNNSHLLSRGHGRTIIEAIKDLEREMGKRGKKKKEKNI